jgi:ribosomal protein S18 acetylase RimI-like enzyme
VNPQVHVRRALEADLPAIARLGDEVNTLHQQVYPEVFAAPGNLDAHVVYWRAQMDEGYRFWLAEPAMPGDAPAPVVGFASARVSDEPASALLQALRPCRVGTVGVTAAWRGRGVGRLLMAQLIEYAAAEQATEIRLNVFSFNRDAIAFYEHLGFETRTQVMVRTARPAPER